MSCYFLSALQLPSNKAACLNDAPHWWYIRTMSVTWNRRV